MTPARLPLDGIVVVALEQAIAAPLASRHLADWGARVIKVERPDAGDFSRNYDHSVHGLSSQFVWTNRSKESLVLDLKDEDGRQTMEALIAGADVFVQNLAPGAAARLGLSAAGLVQRYPRLIACDVSGYGSGGPYSDKKAYDLLVQCETAFVSINGTPESPAKAGLAIADIAAGMYIVQGILMALLQRERSGRGLAFEVSLFDAMTEWMAYPALYTEGMGTAPVRAGVRHATIAPYGPVTTRDSKAIFFGVQNEREWRALCTIVLDQPELADDPRFVGNPLRVAHRGALEAAIGAVFIDLTHATAVARLDEAAIAWAELNTVIDFIAHPQLLSRGRKTTVESPAGVVTSYLPAITIAGLTPIMGPVPALGEHTDAILAELKRDA